MTRSIAWFSCGAASAVAAKLSYPKIIAYCDTGSEDADNERFLKDCEKWFGTRVTRLKSDKYSDTWAVWEHRRYMAGVAGAPCTSELKVIPRLEFQEDDDLHIFGYTADASDVARSERLRESWRGLNVRFPLIERGLTKSACLAIIEDAGLTPPRTYALGLPNANCIPCPKATSPAYWALIRKYYPVEFERAAKLSREIGARLARMGDERVFIDEIPADHPTTKPIVADCDFLCVLAEQEFKE